jgi:hypothetical protein
VGQVRIRVLVFLVLIVTISHEEGPGWRSIIFTLVQKLLPVGVGCRRVSFSDTILSPTARVLVTPRTIGGFFIVPASATTNNSAHLQPILATTFVVVEEAVPVACKRARAVC